MAMHAKSTSSPPIFWPTPVAAFPLLPEAYTAYQRLTMFVKPCLPITPFRTVSLSTVYIAVSKDVYSD